MPQLEDFYCQTLEKRSSFPPNPYEALGAAAFPVLGAPVLLAQPPNSSSAVTFGAGLKLSLAPGTIGVLANAGLVCPHPKSAAAADLGCSGLLTIGAGAAAAGTGEDHSLVPQTSAPDRPAEAKVFEGFMAGAAAAGLLCGDERLKTEFVVAGGEEIGGGGEACVTGADKSKRSSMADDAD